VHFKNQNFQNFEPRLFLCRRKLDTASIWQRDRINAASLKSSMASMALTKGGSPER
jgi:hypothetical protein